MVAPVQHNHTSSDGAGSSVSVVLTSASTSGNQLVAFINWFNATTGAQSNLTSVTDDIDTSGTGYTIVDRVGPLGSGYGASVYRKSSVGGKTITFHFSDANPAFFRAFVAEYSGGDSTSAINAHAADFLSPGATTADAITSGTGATTVNGCLIVGGTFNGGSANLPSVGTSFTSRDSITNSTDGDCSLIEDRTQASSGSVAATFTAVTGGTADNYMVFMLAIPPGAGGGGDVLMGQICL